MSDFKAGDQIKYHWRNNEWKNGVVVAVTKKRVHIKLHDSLHMIRYTVSSKLRHLVAGQ